MAIDRVIRNVFGRFRDLNLLALREHLHQGGVTQGDWASGGNLCPIAHGMANGEVIKQTRYLSQSSGLESGCWFAAARLGGDPKDIRVFVDFWDTADRSVEWLGGQLDLLWKERLADADAVQNLISLRPSLAAQS